MWPGGQVWKPGPTSPATVAAWPPVWWFRIRVFCRRGSLTPDFMIGRRLHPSSPRHDRTNRPPGPVPTGRGARAALGTPTSSSASLKWPQATRFKPPTRSPQSAPRGPSPPDVASAPVMNQRLHRWIPPHPFRVFLLKSVYGFFMSVLLIICNSDLSQTGLSDSSTSRSCINRTTSSSRLVSVIRKPRRDFCAPNCHQL